MRKFIQSALCYFSLILSFTSLIIKSFSTNKINILFLIDIHGNLFLYKKYIVKYEIFIEHQNCISLLRK